MPFELWCPECQKLLRVADEHAGREARCPNCSAVFTATPLAAGASPSHFTHSGSPERADTTNPYASPSTYIDPTSRQEIVSDWSPRLITIEEVFFKSWAIFKEQWVMICLAVLIVGAINIGVNLVLDGIARTISATIEERAIRIVVHIAVFFVLWIFQTWLGIGQMMVIIDIARGHEIHMGKLFSGGPYLINTLLAVAMVFPIFFFIVFVFIAMSVAMVGLNIQDGGAATFVVLLIAILPIIVIVTLIFSQVQLLIIDRGFNAFKSLWTFFEITSGNRLTVCLIAIVLFLLIICAVIAGFLALCIGLIPASIGMGGFTSLVLVVTYLCMTNQHVAVPEY